MQHIVAGLATGLGGFVTPTTKPSPAMRQTPRFAGFATMAFAFYFQRPMAWMPKNTMYTAPNNSTIVNSTLGPGTMTNGMAVRPKATKLAVGITQMLT